GYALIIFILNKIKKRHRNYRIQDYFPTVSFIVAAYNEEDCIEKKILNSLEQDYPPEKIEYIFITDGSSDGTNKVIGKFPQIRLLFHADRRGKSAALNRAVQAANNDILIFSDANTILNSEATKNITRHYQHPDVGGVAGEKKVISSESANEVGAGEGLYWKYESTLKKLDSDFYSVVGAAGELFSLRRSLFEPVAENVILDDFIISMKVAQKGFRIIYEPQAYAIELPSFSMGDEQKRKVRIAAGGFQAMSVLSSLFKFWIHPKLFFLYFSHRVMRWTISPLSLLLAFISNAVLFFSTSSSFFTIAFVLQLLFYGMALLARVIPKNLPAFKLFKLAYYFVFMNLSVILGFFRYLRGRQPAAWEKARRSQLSL
nr:glycosyltransferase family 2 protein [Flavisolibacter sp.]